MFDLNLEPLIQQIKEFNQNQLLTEIKELLTKK